MKETPEGPLESDFSSTWRECELSLHFTLWFWILIMVQNFITVRCSYFLRRMRRKALMKLALYGILFFFKKKYEQCKTIFIDDKTSYRRNNRKLEMLWSSICEILMLSNNVKKNCKGALFWCKNLTEWWWSITLFLCSFQNVKLPVGDMISEMRI